MFLPPACRINELNESFLRACHDGDLHTVKYVLSSPELKTHARIHVKGDSGLRRACRHGHLDIVKYLLASPEIQEHADVHGDDEMSLKWACANGHLEIVSYLLTSSELSEHAHLYTNDYHAHVIHFLLFDMRIEVKPETYELLDHASEQKELVHLVAKRDFFFTMDEKASATHHAPCPKPKI